MRGLSATAELLVLRNHGSAPFACRRYYNHSHVFVSNFPWAKREVDSVFVCGLSRHKSLDWTIAAWLIVHAGDHTLPRLRSRHRLRLKQQIQRSPSECGAVRAFLLPVGHSSTDSDTGVLPWKWRLFWRFCQFLYRTWIFRVNWDCLKRHIFVWFRVFELSHLIIC